MDLMKALNRNMYCGSCDHDLSWVSRLARRMGRWQGSPRMDLDYHRGLGLELATVVVVQDSDMLLGEARKCWNRADGMGCHNRAENELNNQTSKKTKEKHSHLRDMPLLLLGYANSTRRKVRLFRLLRVAGLTLLVYYEAVL